MIEIDSQIKDYIQLGGFVGLAQINPIAGNLEYNSQKIIDYIAYSESIGLDIVAFPQNALMGFYMEDFIKRFPFILSESKKWLEKIAQKCSNISALIGFIDEDKEQAFAILRCGRIDKIIKNHVYITSKEFHDGVEFLIKPTAIPSRVGSQARREEDLKQFFQGMNWIKLHHQFIFFGRYFCKAKKPECNNCKLKKYCRF